MDNILNAKGDNFGSVSELFFVGLPLVQSFPAPNVLTPYVGIIHLLYIQLTGTTKFNRFNFTKETSEYSEVQAIKDGNVFYKQKIECFVAQGDFLKWKSFSEMEYYNFLVLFKDYNGIPKVLGGINKDGEKIGPTLTVDETTNKKWTNLNGYQATFYLESKTKARMVGGYAGIYARTNEDPEIVRPTDIDESSPTD
jgi:hypothetical protein